MAKGVIALLGSGETAPGMTKIHREIFARLQPLKAVNLDTTYGFQANVPQMSKKLEDYFSTSLNVEVETLHFSSYEHASELDRARFAARVRESNYVFAGPGSPTYAVAQWMPLDFANDLLRVLDNAGTLCFSSAAALTLGAFTAPIYEIYKVGTKPHWIAGLDVLGAFGLQCAVIPHFDNNEGGNYDTRFCYLGERRLHTLEGLLPDGIATLGVDEHTALIIDLEQDTLTVKGRGNAYWRTDEMRVLANGEAVALRELRGENAFVRPTPAQVASSDPNDMSALAQRIRDFDPASYETLVTLIEAASNAHDGYIDPTSLIEGVLNVRRLAREQGQYDIADHLRDILTNANLEVNDGPDGSSWTHTNSK
ncbi:MAG: hypothetical protein HIU84_02400 [Acidobacteria bacterium]|nr:hypothetical protein [Acidobacteriota bacterium]